MAVHGGVHHARLLILDQILHSQTFSHCESLRQILRFVVEKSLSGLEYEIKEYTIATEVLGRAADFDPKIDTIVRVQMQRLRRKLEEYYTKEGTADPVRIVIPRGGYVPEIRAPSDSGQAPPEESSHLAPQAKQFIARSNKWLTIGLPWVLVAVLLLLIFVRSFPWPRSAALNVPIRTARAAPTLPRSVFPLWRFFLRPSPPPLIVYSNAAFMMNDAGDLYRCFLNSGISLPVDARVFTSAGSYCESPIPLSAGPLYYMDLYTGTGEVAAVARIVQLLAGENQKFSIRRSRIVSYDDLNDTNVIFIGASLEDSELRQLPIESDLTFRFMSGHAFIGRLYIHDRNPGLGHPDSYHLQRNAKTGALEVDYALVSLLPGLSPQSHILVLGGITTIGTQAAAEFVTSPGRMAIFKRMRPGRAAHDPGSYFQALLKVSIRDGEAAKIDCVLVRSVTHS